MRSLKHIWASQLPCVQLLWLKRAPQLPEFEVNQMIQLDLFNPVILKLTLEFLRTGGS